MASVLITGCSSGFGLEIAVAAARRGWRVYASMRDVGKRGALDQALQGAEVEVVQLDVTDAESIERAVKEVGVVDAVVHNAGVSMGAAFEDMSMDDCRRIIETNFFGVLTLTKAVLPSMRERRRGRIVMISSSNAFLASPGLSLYNASKSALEAWAESVAYEVEPFGISMVLVEPGAYRTEIWNNAPVVIPSGSPYEEMGRQMERRVRWRNERFLRDPAEVARTVMRALESPRPRLRYPVGPDARFFAAAQGVVPWRVRSALVRMGAGIARWRP